MIRSSEYCTPQGKRNPVRNVHPAMFLKEPVLENEIENPIHKTVVLVILCREPKCPGLRRQIVS